MQTGYPGGPAVPEASTPKKRSSTTTIVVIIVVIGFVVLFVGGIFTALAVYGVRKYMTAAKQAEGRVGVEALALGIATCSTQRLPPTTPPVPATLATLRGTKYQSAPEEWDADAFRCAGFAMTSPQYFQYQWQRQTDVAGTARAIADLDGDGSPEVSFELRVSCADGVCSAESAQGLPR
jgi:type IV pilus assembly protein PilA